MLNFVSQSNNSLALVGITVVSWIFNVASLASCTWVHINDDVSLGLFSRSLSDGGGCKSYGSTMDGAHGAARFFAVVTNLALFLSLCGQFFTFFPNLPERYASFRPSAWSSASYLLATATFTNLLTFVFFASRWKSAFCDSQECSSGAAAVLTVLNVFTITGVAAAARWLVIAPSEGEEELDKKEVVQLISEEKGENGKTEDDNGKTEDDEQNTADEPENQEGEQDRNDDEDETKDKPDAASGENVDLNDQSTLPI